jgi:hypothetical protein
VNHESTLPPIEGDFHLVADEDSAGINLFNEDKLIIGNSHCWDSKPYCVNRGGITIGSPDGARSLKR